MWNIKKHAWLKCRNSQLLISGQIPCCSSLWLNIKSSEKEALPSEGRLLVTQPGTSICISIGRAVFWPTSQGLINARVGRSMFCNSRFEFLGRLAFGSLFGPLFITIKRGQTELPYPYSVWSLFGRVSSRNTYERWHEPSPRSISLPKHSTPHTKPF